MEAPVYDISAVIKQEPGKVRSAWNVDTRRYLLTTYLAQAVPQTWDNTWLGKEASSAASLVQWDKFQLPFDYTGWDTNMVTKTMVTSVLTYIAKQSGISDIYIDKFLYTPFTYKGTPWEGGMVSGESFTAWMNSLLNNAVANAVAEVAGISIDTNNTGDDAMIQGDSFDLLTFLDTCKTMKVQYNPRKMYIDKDRTEYLRYEFRPGQIRGYPLRMISSMIQRHPWSADPDSRITKMVTLVSNAHKLAARYGQPVAWDWLDLEAARSGVPRPSQFMDYASGFAGPGFRSLALTPPEERITRLPGHLVTVARLRRLGFLSFKGLDRLDAGSWHPVVPKGYKAYTSSQRRALCSAMPIQTKSPLSEQQGLFLKNPWLFKLNRVQEPLTPGQVKSLSRITVLQEYVIGTSLAQTAVAASYVKHLLESAALYGNRVRTTKCVTTYAPGCYG